MDKQQEIKEFQAFIVEEAKSKGKDPNQYAKELGEDGLKEAYKRYQAQKQKAKEKEVQKALHGAKLNYFKRLKNQCAEDEEIVYYKKGGSVKCGCKKKEDGGEVVKAQDGVVAKFKNTIKRITEARTARKNGTTIPDKNGEYRDNKENIILTKKGIAEREKVLNANKNEEGKADPNKKTPSKACGGKASKMKNNLPLKVKEEKCGGAVKKFKKHYNGGSLNRIPFMQKGTPKEGIVEKSDNTRVNRIPNNGEGVYEMTPQGIGDFLPIIATYRDAKRIDNGEPNASYANLALNLGMDILGGRMIGSTVKAATKANRIYKALKSAGFRQVGTEPTKFIKPAQRASVSFTPSENAVFLRGATKTTGISPTYITKNIPNVDYANVAMQPLIQSLRVPVTAPFK